MPPRRDSYRVARADEHSNRPPIAAPNESGTKPLRVVLIIVVAFRRPTSAGYVKMVALSRAQGIVTIGLMNSHGCAHGAARCGIAGQQDAHWSHRLLLRRSAPSTPLQVVRRSLLRARCESILPPGYPGNGLISDRGARRALILRVLLEPQCITGSRHRRHLRIQPA